nr:hypothetical protein [Actinomycetales bacterium]
MLLILGFSTLVIALILVVASVAALHIERKQLLAAADAAALSASARLDPVAYHEIGGGTVRVTDAGVRAAVTEYFDTYSATLGLRDVRVGEPTGATDGRLVTVTVSGLAEIPLVPWLTDAIPEWVRIEVTASARAGE